MFWRIAANDAVNSGDDFALAGRFVLHRHVDAQGEHLDLRLEADGHLRGWRVDADALAPGAWATEKPPHSLRWLDEGVATGETGGPANGVERVDAGDYAVESWGRDGGAIVLRGAGGVTRLAIAPAPELPVAAARAIAESIRMHELNAHDAPALIADGVAARSRAIQRLCGLGRELDGDTFDESVWRKTLRGLTLDEIHHQLRAFEVRFDQKYPPLPVSRPETEGETPRTRDAMAIARE